MSKLLLIGFSADELSLAGGFIQAMSCEFDALLLSGSSAPVTSAGRVMTFAQGGSLPPDAAAASIAGYTAGYTHVAAVSSMAAKDTFARLAGLVDAPMVTDVIGIEGPHRFRRPIVAGSLIETVEVNSPLTLMTFRPSGFSKLEPSGTTPAEAVAFSGSGKTVITQAAQRRGGRPDLSQAKIIVSGGRPLRDAATFEQVIGGLADALHGAAGATRAAVDSGIAANELQVGQTGKIVAPDLYIAAGVSGSTQHMAGIKDSKIIVAINTDANAPIFEVADFGLVQDLYTALPEIQSKLR